MIEIVECAVGTDNHANQNTLSPRQQDFLYRWYRKTLAKATAVIGARGTPCGLIPPPNGPAPVSRGLLYINFPVTK